MCSARNVGIDISKGKYILFVDADDRLFPNSLEVLYNNMIQYNCDASFGESVSSKVFFNNLYHQPQNNKCEIWENQTALIESLKSNNKTFSIWAKLFKREILHKIKFVEGRSVNEDSYYLFCILLKKPKICLCKDIVYWYNLSNASNAQKRLVNNAEDVIYFLNLKKESIQQSYPDLMPLFTSFEYNTYLNILDNICMAADDSHKELESECVEFIKANISNQKATKTSHKRIETAIKLHIYPLYKKTIKLKSTKR